MAGIAVQIPVTTDRENGITLLKNFDDVAAQNLKMLVLTVPGERMMDPDFGVGARRFLFEQMTDSTFRNFESRLYAQQRKYLPYIQITKVEFISALTHPNTDENTLGIQIFYFNTISQNSNTLLLPIS
jgi:phage baseplate assembly protein W